MAQIYEYRGVEGLVYAEVTKDDSTGYETGTVKPLAGVAEVGKTSNSSTESHWYDNIPACNVTAQGTDTITINVSAIPLEVLADITGQNYDEDIDTLIEGERIQKYFAIGYKTQATNGDEYYVWRLKGTFNIPDETHQTKNDSTDANGQELTFTGIFTTYKFNKYGKPEIACTTNATRDKIANKAGFFNSVQTPDTITAKSAVPSVSVVPSRAEVTVGEKVQLQSIVVPPSAAVTWTSNATTYATVNASTGEVTGEAAGTATITASITVGTDTYTDTCSVTVNAPSA